MDIRIGNVAFDCYDPRSLAEFWMEALGYEAKYLEDTYALLRDREGKNPKIYLQQVPEAKAGKNRAHVDLYAPDEKAEAERLEKLGATVVRRFDSDGDYWVVMQDPQGNEFCICRSRSLDDAWR